MLSGPPPSSPAPAGRPPAEVYLVDVAFRCNGVCNTGTIAAMAEIVGMEFLGGRLRMNANQLCRLLLALGTPGDGIGRSLRQYEVVRAERDVSAIVDVSMNWRSA